MEDVIKDRVFKYDGSPSGDGRDTNALWIGPGNKPTRYVNCLVDGRGASEGLKVTGGAKELIFDRCTFIGGEEDCVDLLGCENVNFMECTFRLERAWQLATIKGGARKVMFYKPVIHGNPLEHTYFDLGGHTIYKDDLRPTKEVMIILPELHNSEKTLSFSRTWNAEKPMILIQDKYKEAYTFKNFSIPKPLWKLYFSLRNRKVL